MQWKIQSKSNILNDWKEEIEDEDECGFKEIKISGERALTIELNETCKKLIKSYSAAAENHAGLVCHHLNIRVLNLGVQIGIELQKAFHENEE